MTLDALIQAHPQASDAEIAAMLPARTAGPIPLAALKPWADNRGLLRRLTRTIDSAVFAGVIDSAGLPVVAIRDAAGGAIDFINSPHNTQIDTHDPTADPETGQTYYAKTSLLLGLMVACNDADPTLGMTADEATAFLAFGGGVIDPPTADAIAACRRTLRYTAACRAGQDAGANLLLADPAATGDALKGAWLTAYDDAMGAE